MSEDAAQSDDVDVNLKSQPSQSTVKQAAEKSRRSGEKKEGRRLVDDTATLLNLALQASGAQQEEVTEKLEKLRKRDAGRVDKPAESPAAQRGRSVHKSKKLREMKEQIKSNRGRSTPKGPKEGNATGSNNRSSRKKVAFE